MPQGDRTGPNGEGPMTGRGLGPCARGQGFRRGSGRGFGRNFASGRFLGARPIVQEPVELDAKQEKQILESELKEIEAEKVEIQKRLKEIK